MVCDQPDSRSHVLKTHDCRGKPVPVERSHTNNRSRTFPVGRLLWSLRGSWAFRVRQLPGWQTRRWKPRSKRSGPVETGLQESRACKSASGSFCSTFLPEDLNEKRAQYLVLKLLFLTLHSRLEGLISSRGFTLCLNPS